MKNNLTNKPKPHFEKVKFFLKKYPYKLICNEYQVKFDMKINGKKTTYNPDFFCKKTNKYIEVVTSKPNISEQGIKWRKALKMGKPLKVFWWEGNEITNSLYNPKRKSK